ncbi:hypothetical protein RJ640_000368 [Escallonia rubra]|uniref:Uncharacterized protein n=1 Tax=Escallonia rubra TaxID=112253 RepID=A0AA88R4G6_9ASTE|nr:hypothetical protein RJ640_000368 [Escallonia rubra]
MATREIVHDPLKNKTQSKFHQKSRKTSKHRDFTTEEQKSFTRKEILAIYGTPSEPSYSTSGKEVEKQYVEKFLKEAHVALLNRDGSPSEPSYSTSGKEEEKQRVEKFLKEAHLALLTRDDEEPQKPNDGNMEEQKSFKRKDMLMSHGNPSEQAKTQCVEEFLKEAHLALLNMFAEPPKQPNGSPGEPKHPSSIKQAEKQYVEKFLREAHLAFLNDCEEPKQPHDVNESRSPSLMCLISDRAGLLGDCVKLQKWNQKDRSARYTLLSSLQNDLIGQYDELPTCKALWEQLKFSFGGTSTTRLRSLVIKFEEYTKDPKHTMSEHLRVMSNMIGKLRDARHALTDE